MASSSATPGGSGIPLQEFRRDCPPGWSPGLPDYPLRLFFDKLKLWYQIFDGADELVGPLVAGRLQGKAQRLALQLRLPRPDGGVDVGSDALVRLSVDEVRDPTNPAIILQTAIPSWIQSLCNSLRDAFGFSDQELVSKSIEDFMEFRRGRVAFSEFSIEFDMRLEEATLVDDIKLQIQGDLRRFQEARALAFAWSIEHRITTTPTSWATRTTTGMTPGRTAGTATCTGRTTMTLGRTSGMMMPMAGMSPQRGRVL